MRKKSTCAVFSTGWRPTSGANLYEGPVEILYEFTFRKLSIFHIILRNAQQ